MAHECNNPEYNAGHVDCGTETQYKGKPFTYLCCLCRCDAEILSKTEALASLTTGLDTIQELITQLRAGASRGLPVERVRDEEEEEG